MTFDESAVHPVWTAEIAAAVIVNVILAGIKINRILSNVLQKKNTDHDLIEYMWNLLSDVVYLKTPVELPDFYKIRN